MPARSAERKPIRRALTLAVGAFAALAIGFDAVPARAANDPIVHVFVHLPMNVPVSLPGWKKPWYCAPQQQHMDRPIPPGLLVRYERDGRARGNVRDHFGLGSWRSPLAGASDGDDIAFEEDDHVEIITRLSVARAWLPAFLEALRSDTSQMEALGEIVGVAIGSERQRRVRVMVTLPERRLDARALFTLHGIFADGLAGGASQYDDESGVHVYSGVIPAHVDRIEGELRRAGFAYTTEPETFVTADAPAC